MTGPVGSERLQSLQETVSCLPRQPHPFQRQSPLYHRCAQPVLPASGPAILSGGY